MTEKTLEMLYDELKEAAVKAAETANDPDASDELIKQAKVVMNDRLLRYNRQAAKVAYLNWNTMEHPVVEALKTLYVPDAKRATVRKDRKTGKYIAAVNDDKEYKIDLNEMMKTIGAEKFQDRRWFAACQKAVYIIAGNLSKDLGNSKEFLHYLDEAGKAFNFSEEVDPTSNNSCVKALQFIVHAIVPEASREGDLKEKFTVVKKDWIYIRESLTKNGGVGKVVMSDTSKIVEFVEDVLYCHLNDIKYELVG